MRIGYRPPTFRSARLELPVDKIRLADDLGYHSFWTGEAYGADAFTPLAYVAAITTRMRLGVSVAQIDARAPAATAMQAMTIDAMAGGGRFALGLGVSGPQIVEGWYGRPWGDPVGKLRDYVAVVRKVMSRGEPVAHDGPNFTLPYDGPGAVGQGKPLRSMLHPEHPIPILLAAGGDRMIELARDVADGCLPMGYFPTTWHRYTAPGDWPDTDRASWEVVAPVSVVITTEVRRTIQDMKPLIAMYVGGMGSATHNFHKTKMDRAGFDREAAEIQRLWLRGDKDAATREVPDEYVEAAALIGTPARIRSRWNEFVSAPGLTEVILTGESDEAAIRLVADLASAPAGART